MLHRILLHVNHNPLQSGKHVLITRGRRLDLGLGKPHNRSEASWRQMHLTQPSSRNLVVVITVDKIWVSFTQWSAVCRDVTNPGGVRMGDIVEACDRVVSGHEDQQVISVELFEGFW